jgi:hypothetical protein
MLNLVSVGLMSSFILSQLLLKHLNVLFVLLLLVSYSLIKLLMELSLLFKSSLLLLSKTMFQPLLLNFVKVL